MAITQIDSIREFVRRMQEAKDEKEHRKAIATPRTTVDPFDMVKVDPMGGISRKTYDKLWFEENMDLTDPAPKPIKGEIVYKMAQQGNQWEAPPFALRGESIVGNGGKIFGEANAVASEYILGNANGYVVDVNGDIWHRAATAFTVEKRPDGKYDLAPTSSNTRTLGKKLVKAVNALNSYVIPYNQGEYGWSDPFPQTTQGFDDAMHLSKMRKTGAPPPAPVIDYSDLPDDAGSW